MIPPTMWREELYHPLTVHFPIALLLMGSLFYLAFLVSNHHFFEKAALLNLFFGLLAAWVSIYLGQRAESIVNRIICDPTMTHLHEDYAFYATWVFSACFLLLSIQSFLGNNFPIRVTLFLILVVGCCLLIYTGHLGATLVYQQGAAVYHPSSECSEFAE